MVSNPFSLPSCLDTHPRSLWLSLSTLPPSRHVNNFILLFASNVENLLACLFRKYIDSQLDDSVESLLAILYMYCVLKNLLWFIDPLKEREDFALLLTWFEVRVEFFKEKLHWFISMTRPWAKMSEDKEAGNKGKHHHRKLFGVVRTLQALSTLDHKSKTNKTEESQKQTAEAKRD